MMDGHRQAVIYNLSLLRASGGQLRQRRGGEEGQRRELLVRRSVSARGVTAAARRDADAPTINFGWLNSGYICKMRKSCGT